MKEKNDVEKSFGQKLGRGILWIVVLYMIGSLIYWFYQ